MTNDGKFYIFIHFRRYNLDHPCCEIFQQYKNHLTDCYGKQPDNGEVAQLAAESNQVTTSVNCVLRCAFLLSYYLFIILLL